MALGLRFSRNAAISVAGGQNGSGSPAWYSSTRVISSTSRLARSAIPFAWLSPGVLNLRSMSFSARRRFCLRLISSLALSEKYDSTGQPGPVPLYWWLDLCCICAARSKSCSISVNSAAFLVRRKRTQM